MHGNAQEWCQDSWHASYDGAPNDARPWIDHDEPVAHVVRGGAAYTIATACRSAARRQQRANCGARKRPPEDEEENSLARFLRSSRLTEFYGLRVVCVPTEGDIG